MAEKAKAEKTDQVLAEPDDQVIVDKVSEHKPDPGAVKETSIRYKGSTSERFVTPEQWASAGVPDQERISWNRGNNFIVPKSRFSDVAVDVILADPAFEIVEPDSE
jgi:hypothetical protein